MKIYKTYSHLCAEEHLLVHKPYLYSEIRCAIKSIDSSKCKTMVLKNKQIGSQLFHSRKLADAFSDKLFELGWMGRRGYFIKEGVAIEFQFGKLLLVAFDLFVKHLSFFNAGVINVGVEIVPSKELQEQMSSGPPFFEKEVHNILRHGRNSPAVPIIMIGVSP